MPAYRSLTIHSTETYIILGQSSTLNVAQSSSFVGFIILKSEGMYSILYRCKRLHIFNEGYKDKNREKCKISMNLHMQTHSAIYWTVSYVILYSFRFVKLIKAMVMFQILTIVATFEIRAVTSMRIHNLNLNWN